MDGVLVGIFLISAIILGILLIVETVEYMRYRKAVAAVIAFGESMQKSFDEVSKQLNRVTGQNYTLAESMSLVETDMTFIKAVVQIHSEALKLHSLTKEIKEKVSDRDGQDIIREVQG